VLWVARAAVSAEPATINGSWEGSLDLGAAQLRLLFNFNTDANGRLAGTLDSPDQGAYGIAFDSVALTDNALRCEVRRISGVFAGTFDPPNARSLGNGNRAGARTSCRCGPPRR
jgi:uncharacterized protein